MIRKISRQHAQSGDHYVMTLTSHRHQLIEASDMRAPVQPSDPPLPTATIKSHIENYLHESGIETLGCDPRVRMPRPPPPPTTTSPLSSSERNCEQRFDATPILRFPDEYRYRVPDLPSLDHQLRIMRGIEHGEDENGHYYPSDTVDNEQTR